MINNLLEKYGISEFENDLFNKLILQLNNDILLGNGSIKDVLGYQFKNICINLSNCCKWIDYLNIFYSDNLSIKSIIGGTSVTITENNGVLYNTYYKKSYDHIQIASIFIYVDQSYNLGVLYHEIAHIYDSTKIIIDYSDEIYSLKNEYSIPNKIITEFSISLLHNLIKYCMYYSNISEKHAFIETARFEIINSLSNYFNFYRYLKNRGIKINKSNILLNSSITINDYYWMVNSLKNAKNVSDRLKSIYIEKYGNELCSIYGKKISVNFDKLINLLLNRLEHSYNNMCKLFTYYYELYNIEKIYKLNENAFGGFIHSSIMNKNKRNLLFEKNFLDK